MKLALALWLWAAHAGNQPIEHGGGRALITFKNQSGRAVEHCKVSIDDTPIYQHAAPPDELDLFNGAMPDGSYRLDVTVRLRRGPTVHSAVMFDVPAFKWLLLDV